MNVREYGYETHEVISVAKDRLHRFTYLSVVHFTLKSTGALLILIPHHHHTQIKIIKFWCPTVHHDISTGEIVVYQGHVI